MEPTLGLRFVVNTIKADDALQENVELGVRPRVLRDLEQWTENICDARVVRLYCLKGMRRIVLMIMSSNVFS